MRLPKTSPGVTEPCRCACDRVTLENSISTWKMRLMKFHLQPDSSGYPAGRYFHVQRRGVQRRRGSLGSFAGFAPPRVELAAGSFPGDHQHPMPSIPGRFRRKSSRALTSCGPEPLTLLVAASRSMERSIGTRIATSGMVCNKIEVSGIVKSRKAGGCRETSDLIDHLGMDIRAHRLRRSLRRSTLQEA